MSVNSVLQILRRAEHYVFYVDIVFFLNKTECELKI